MTGKPFFFDQNIFEPDEHGYEAEREDSDALKHTDQAIAQAKAQGFAQGKEQGIKEAEGGLTKQVLVAIQNIEREVSILSASEKGRNTRYENEAAHLTYQIINTMFPTLQKHLGDMELQTKVQEILNTFNTPESIKITLPENVSDSVTEHISKASEKLSKQIQIIKDETLQNGEAHITWPEGGIISNQSAIADKTFVILKEALAERGVSVHDKVEHMHDDEIPESSEPSDELKEQEESDQ